MGMSQVELAIEVGVTQQTVSEWEAATISPRDELKVLIADALRQDVSQLFPLVRS